MPKRYLVFKWAVYAGAVLALLFLFRLLLEDLSLRGIHPFLLPMVAGVVASYEGSVAGPVFALVFGFFCDLGSPASPPGFYTFAFALAALVASLLAENLFSPGFLCSLASTAICYLVTALGRCLVLSGAPLPQVLLLAAQEFLLSLPMLLGVFPLFRWLPRKTAVEY